MEFAQLFIERLRAAGDQREIVLDEEEFRILFDAGDETTRGVLHLSNLYLEFTQVDEDERDNFLSLLIRSAFSHLKPIPEEFEFAAYDIRPKLWSRGTIEQINLKKKMDREEPLDWPLESVGEHLYLSLVYDLPESVRSISSKELDDWGTNYWEVRERAMTNLSEVEFQCVSMDDELYVSTTGDAYDATRLVLPGLIDKFEVKGRPIVMVPNRESLLLSGLDSEVGLKMMIELATEQLLELPRPMIGTPLVLSDDNYWEDWFPEPDHPLYAEFQGLKVAWLRSEYESQQELLVQFLDSKGNTAMAATYQVIQSDGIYRGLALLLNGIPTLLPDSDWVAVLDPESQEMQAVCDLQLLLKHAPDRIQASEKFYPKRFLVFDPFTDSEIEAARIDVEL